MRKCQILKLKKILQSKFGVFMHYSLMNSMFYCDFVSQVTTDAIVDFLNTDVLYSDVKVFRKPSGFLIIEF